MHHEILGHACLQAHVDLKACPWMESALQKFRTQQPASRDQKSDVFGFLDTVHDTSRRNRPPVQHWTDGHCTNWCSAFVNWCLEIHHYRGSDNALALPWRFWGKPSPPRWGCIAVVTHPFHHVGFFISRKYDRDAGVDYVYILGGNQSDRDHHRSFRSVNIDRFNAKTCHIEYRMPLTAK